MCSWFGEIVTVYLNHRDSTGVLPIRRQKVKTFQSSFRLIPALYFSMLFILYIGAEMIQIHNKLQK